MAMRFVLVLLPCMQFTKMFNLFHVLPIPVPSQSHPTTSYSVKLLCLRKGQTLCAQIHPLHREVQGRPRITKSTTKRRNWHSSLNTMQCMRSRSGLLWSRWIETLCLFCHSYSLGISGCSKILLLDIT